MEKSEISWFTRADICSIKVREVFGLRYQKQLSTNVLHAYNTHRCISCVVLTLCSSPTLHGEVTFRNLIHHENNTLWRRKAFVELTKHRRLRNATLHFFQVLWSHLCTSVRQEGSARAWNDNHVSPLYRAWKQLSFEDKTRVTARENMGRKMQWWEADTQELHQNLLSPVLHKSLAAIWMSAVESRNLRKAKNICWAI